MKRSLKQILGIQTELTKLNVKEIIANYRNPKFWKKEWTVFKTREFSVVWQMSYIHVENNAIQSKVRITNFRRKGLSFWLLPSCYCDSIPIDNPDYSQGVFERNILNKIFVLITDLEKAIVRTTYEYRQAEQLEEDEREKLEEIANDFLDSEGVSNKEIREAYVDYYVGNATKYNYTSEILSTSKRKYYPTARLLACSWFDNKKMFEEESKIVAVLKGVKKKAIYDIWKAKKELEGEDYLKEAEEQLESL